MYDLPPFDPHFDPLKHNKYLARWDSEKIKKYFAQIFTFQAGEAEAAAGRGEGGGNIFQYGLKLLSVFLFWAENNGLTI